MSKRVIFCASIFLKGEDCCGGVFENFQDIYKKTAYFWSDRNLKINPLKL